MAENDIWFKRITTCIGTLTAVIAVVIGGRQLDNFNRQLAADRNQRTLERTLQVVQTYLTNSYYVTEGKDIRENTRISGGPLQSGTIYDYSILAGNTVLMDEAFDILNFLEMVATGVQQQVYDENIVRDHFDKVVHKAVIAFLRGEDGVIDDSRWKGAGKKLWSESAFPNLRWLYSKWFGEPNNPHFKNN
jgi:hypothetical protein